MKNSRLQQLYFDGLETSIDIARCSFVHLTEALLEYSMKKTGKAAIAQEEKTHILLYAWTVVDSIHRFISLLAMTPGLKKSTAVDLILRQGDDISKLRNHIQHMNNAAAEIDVSGYPVWGYLSWLYATSEMYDAKEVHSLLFVPGRLSVSKGYRSINPAAGPFSIPIGRVTLSIEDTSVELSRVMERVSAFYPLLQSAISDAEKNDIIDTKGHFRLIIN